jgi:hypothetical protein
MAECRSTSDNKGQKRLRCHHGRRIKHAARNVNAIIALISSTCTIGRSRKLVSSSTRRISALIESPRYFGKRPMTPPSRRLMPAVARSLCWYACSRLVSVRFIPETPAMTGESRFSLPGTHFSAAILLITSARSPHWLQRYRALPRSRPANMRDHWNNRIVRFSTGCRVALIYLLPTRCHQIIEITEGILSCRPSQHWPSWPR